MKSLNILLLNVHFPNWFKLCHPQALNSYLCVENVWQRSDNYAHLIIFWWQTELAKPSLSMLPKKYTKVYVHLRCFAWNDVHSQRMMKKTLTFCVNKFDLNRRVCYHFIKGLNYEGKKLFEEIVFTLLPYPLKDYWTSLLCLI